MHAFIPWLLANPLFCIGAVISFIACIGFLIFLRGFLLALPHLLYIDGHDEHVGHARVRVTWGVVLMSHMFVLWVAIRGLATIFGYDTANLGTTGNILLCYTVLVGLLYFTGFAFVKEKK